VKYLIDLQVRHYKIIKPIAMQEQLYHDDTEPTVEVCSMM